MNKKSLRLHSCLLYTSHFVVAMLKSSEKGATIVSCRDGFHREVTENGVTEYRPYGKFELTGNNQLAFSLNTDQLKIPKKLLSDIIDRFRMDIHKECALPVSYTHLKFMSVYLSGVDIIKWIFLSRN